MLLDAEWPWNFQNVVIIEILTKNDAVMVFPKFSMRKFTLCFDHSFEEHTTFIARALWLFWEIIIDVCPWWGTS
jgi:hypothetical protein